MDIGSAQNFSQSSRNTVIAASVVGKSVLFHEICHPIEMITHPAIRVTFFDIVLDPWSTHFQITTPQHAHVY